MKRLQRIVFSIGVLCLALPTAAIAYKQSTHMVLSARALELSDAADGSLFGLVGQAVKANEAIMLGASLEDETDIVEGKSHPRAFNHFYNPLNGEALSLSAFGHELGPIGHPSPDWIIDGIGQPLDNLHSFHTALDRFYSAITSGSQTERADAARKLFLDLGHLVHHIQDMAQPQHVRNDPHCDATDCITATQLLGNPLPKVIGVPSGYELHSATHEGEFSDDKITPAPVPVYSRINQNAAFKTARDFWTSNCSPTCELDFRGTGIADISNRLFVTYGTNFQDCSSSQNLSYCPGGFAHPATEETSLQPIEVERPRLGGGTSKFTEYLVKETAAAPSLPPSTSEVDTTGVISRTSIFSGFQNSYQFSIDSNAYIYANSLLIPRAISYSAGLINFFFRGNTDASLDTSGKVVIKNLGPFLPSGHFELWYDDENNIRQKSGWQWSTFSGLPTGTTISTDLPLPNNITNNSSPGRFVLVYRSSDIISVGSRLVAGKIVTLASEPPPPPPPPPTGCTAATFTDNFSRPDGAVGNGWFDGLDNGLASSNGNLQLLGGKLTTPVTSGRSMSYRPFDTSKGVTISGTLTETNGNNIAGRRYESAIWIGSDGHYTSGYGIYFGRSQSGINNSGVALYLNGVQLAVLSSSFQFGQSITLNVTFLVDGTVKGTIQGDGQTFPFNFGPRTVDLASLPGSNVLIELQNGNCCLRPTFDDVSLSCPQ